VKLPLEASQVTQLVLLVVISAQLCTGTKELPVSKSSWLAGCHKSAEATRYYLGFESVGVWNMMLVRAQWPHTIEDITKALDGVWGVVGATSENGTLFRLERTLKEPTTYTLIEYVGADENAIASTDTFAQDKREEAVKRFAKAIGFAI
jgi:hypothetical protein